MYHAMKRKGTVEVKFRTFLTTAPCEVCG